VRRSLPLLALLLATTACGGGNDPGGYSDSSSGEAANSTAADADMALPPEGSAPRSRSTRQAGPDIRPASAPGVAFNYNYAFRLDAPRVAEVQQEHQRLCEAYTVSRCRVTGMVYRRASEDDVEAMLSFRVDPAIAGRFGRESVQAVTAAEGLLTDSEITGTDVGSGIQAATRDLAALEAELERIEQRLRTAGASAKGQLEYEAQMLRQQIRDLRSSRQSQQQSLATTPMVFKYGSGSLAPGFDQPPSLGEALEDTGDDFLYSLNLLLVVLVRLLPWAAAGLLIWGVINLIRRRRPRLTAPTELEVAA
jgi:hypothetical protein